MAPLKPLTVLILTLHVVASALVYLLNPLPPRPRFESLSLLRRLFLSFGLFFFAHSIPVDMKKFPFTAFSISLSIPFAVAFHIPLVLYNADLVSHAALFDHTRAPFAFYIGVTLGLFGGAILLWTTWLFYAIGKGTLSPDENLSTSELILIGPYKYTRNPMITGALFTLIAHALVANSPRIMCFALAFMPIKTYYFVFVEEPRLMQKFGNDYAEYKRHVPRWIPKLTPYTGGAKKRD